jgi:hypothetical protein
VIYIYMDGLQKRFGKAAPGDAAALPDSGR